jgi:hypothetical protein
MSAINLPFAVPRSKESFLVYICPLVTKKDVFT